MHIFTFGGAMLIPKGDFAEAINYVNSGDPVPPFGGFFYKKQPDTTVIYMGKWMPPIFFSRHHMSSYKKALNDSCKKIKENNGL